MTGDILLYVLTAALVVLVVIAFGVCLWRRSHPDYMTTTEWRERMRQLEAEEPSKRPKFLSKHVSKGAVGVCYPESAKNRRKVAVLRKTGIGRGL